MDETTLRTQISLIEELARKLAVFLRSDRVDRDRLSYYRALLKQVYNASLETERLLEPEKQSTEQPPAEEPPGDEPPAEEPSPVEADALVEQFWINHRLSRDLDRAVAESKERKGGFYQGNRLGLIRVPPPLLEGCGVKWDFVDTLVERYTSDARIEIAMEALVERLQSGGYKVPERPQAKVGMSWRITDENELIWGKVKRGWS